ncbi:MAG: hypothetical protein JW909_07425 [Planctomycetes bacterium]|nr:hypothetical protein [Planctomycetota bacterium]
MTGKIQKACWVLLVVFGAAGAEGTQALVYKQVSTRTFRDAVGKEKSEVLHQTIIAARDAILTQTEELDVITVLRPAEGTLCQYDPRRNIYAVMSVQAGREKIQQYKSLLSKHYDRMDRSKKERLAVVLGKVRPRAKALSEKKTSPVAGYDTRKVSFYENGRLRMEFWLTDAFDFGADMTPLLEATGEFSRELLALKRKERGFAMRSRVFPVLEINPQVENEVTEVCRRDVPDDMFLIPEGFKRVDSIEPGPPPENEDGEDRGSGGDKDVPETAAPAKAEADGREAIPMPE